MVLWGLCSFMGSLWFPTALRFPWPYGVLMASMSPWAAWVPHDLGSPWLAWGEAGGGPIFFPWLPASHNHCGIPMGSWESLEALGGFVGSPHFCTPP